MTPLKVLLDVLDRADTLSKNTAAPSAEQVLADVTQLGTLHDSAVLKQAVQDQLASKPLVVTPPSDAFSWSWDRPANEEERQTRLTRTQRMAWSDPHEKRQQRTEVAKGGGALLGALMAIGTLTWAALTHHSLHNDPIFAIPWVFGTAAGVWSGYHVGSLWARWRRRRCFAQRQALLPFHGDLAYHESVYLDFPKTRQYLRAVLSSPIPMLLEGDAETLDTLATLATLEAQERKARQHEEEIQKRIQASIQASIHPSARRSHATVQ